MTRLLLALMALGLFGGTPQASAACQKFGTQLECNFGESQVLIGTQEVTEPAYAGALRPPSLVQRSDALDARTAPGWPIRLDLQNVAADPGLCEKWGNETYCY
jgi:hypothetical protein